jgi:hypothetical protein
MIVHMPRLKRGMCCDGRVFKPARCAAILRQRDGGLFAYEQLCGRPVSNLSCLSSGLLSRLQDDAMIYRAAEQRDEPAGKGPCAKLLNGPFCARPAKLRGSAGLMVYAGARIARDAHRVAPAFAF